MRCETGQVAVGLVLGAAIVGALAVLLAGALISVAPEAWREVVDERVRARERVLGTGRELHPEWRRIWSRDGG